MTLRLLAESTEKGGPAHLNPPMHAWGDDQALRNRAKGSD